MAAARALIFRKPSSFSFSVQNILRYNAKSISSAAKPSTEVPTTSKSQKAAKKEADMSVQSHYRDNVKNVVSRFRDERMENLRLRQAAEGEQQKLLEREKVEEKRIIEGVKLENEKLEQLRKERLEIEEWTKNYKKMRREFNHWRHQQKLREMRVDIVKQAIEESKDFITPENLEEKIAFALDNETYYNFALKPNGERVYSTAPPGNSDTELPGSAAFVFTSPFFEKNSEDSSDDSKK